jgi:predicted HTH transcriptional regulator
MLTDQQLAEAMAFGREQSAIEFKSPGPRSSRRLLAQVIRAMLGMSNRRDGGYVVIGVRDNGKQLFPDGLDASDLPTWAYDHLADSVASHVDPSIQFDVRVARLDVRDFVIVHVSEFAEVPILCRRGYSDGKETVLREGACYIRPRRKPETMEVGTYADMRDLLDLASEKLARRFLATAGRTGLRPAQRRNDRAAFDRQIEDFL